MGLLDDAIREHLDLKRRHGAAEDEVRRQEQEALGPPRRGEVPEPLAPPATVAESEPEPEPEVEEAPETVISVPFEPVHEPDPEPEPGPEPEFREDPYAGEPWAADPEPPPVTEPEPPPAAYAAPPAAEPGEEDVLEETPDFLQETPEHDRLWFEQKPPKDFDFDK